MCSPAPRDAGVSTPYTPQRAGYLANRASMGAAKRARTLMCSKRPPGEGSLLLHGSVECAALLRVVLPRAAMPRVAPPLRGRVLRAAARAGALQPCSVPLAR